MKTIIIVVIIAITIAGFFLLSKKSKFTGDILNTNYSNNGTNYSNNGSIPSCDFNYENRVYPSGNIPGSYLGLNPSEKEMLLKKFIEYKGELPEYASFKN
jgi:hypothetical protein